MTIKVPQEFIDKWDKDSRLTKDGWARTLTEQAAYISGCAATYLESRSTEASAKEYADKYYDLNDGTNNWAISYTAYTAAKELQPKKPEPDELEKAFYAGRKYTPDQKCAHGGTYVYNDFSDYQARLVKAEHEPEEQCSECGGKRKG